MRKLGKEEFKKRILQDQKNRKEKELKKKMNADQEYISYVTTLKEKKRRGRFRC